MGTLAYLIVFAVIVLIIVIIIAVIYQKISHSVKNISRMAFGTDNIIEGFKKQQELYETTPKSISAMTRLYLPQISKDFPEFNWDDYKRKTESLVRAYLNALETQKNVNLDYVSLSLRDKIESEIEQLKLDGMSIDFQNINIHCTEITSYKKINGLCTINTETSVGYTKIIKNSSGENSSRIQTVYKTDLVYIQNDEELLNMNESFVSNTCPNCGGAITSLGSKVCEYCGSALKDININSWKFTSVSEKK